MVETYVTFDPDVVRQWAQERLAVPAKVKGSEELGLVRLHFVGYEEDDEDLEDISWGDFAEAFENNNMAMIYQEETDEGEKSTFHRFIDRDSFDYAEEDVDWIS